MVPRRARSFHGVSWAQIPLDHSITGSVDNIPLSSEDSPVVFLLRVVFMYFSEIRKMRMQIVLNSFRLFVVNIHMHESVLNHDNIHKLVYTLVGLHIVCWTSIYYVSLKYKLVCKWNIGSRILHHRFDTPTCSSRPLSDWIRHAQSQLFFCPSCQC